MNPHLPTRLVSTAGLRAEINANGSVRRMDCGDIILNLFLGTEIEGGPANIYLRRRGRRIESTPLLGPQSSGAVALGEHGFASRGEWKGIRFSVSLVLPPAARAWLWRVEVENVGKRAAVVDLIYAQDIALAHYGAVRNNEYYVSQYIDFTPLRHERHGTVLAVRQNLPMGGRHPWAVLGSLGSGVGFATDALQFHALNTRAGLTPPGLTKPNLPSTRLQHEHSMAVIQDQTVRLPPGASARRGFFGWFEPDHPAATAPADIVFVDTAVSLETTTQPGGVVVAGLVPAGRGVRSGHKGRDYTETSPGASHGRTLFSTCPNLASLDLTDTEVADLFGNDWRQVERRDGRTHSFFADEVTHVVLKAKELTVLRPHGHIMRTGNHLTPDEASLTSTAWMNGVFTSMLTQGHVNINRFLSTTRSYLSLLRASGQRVFVALADGYYLLDVPSAFAMTTHGCRWIYKHSGGVIEVRSTAARDRHEVMFALDVVDGGPCRFLLSHHVALNGDDGADAVPAQFVRDERGIIIRPIADSDVGRRFPDGTFRIDADDGTVVEQVGGDELLFVDGQSRDQPFLVIVTAPAASVRFRITGQLIAPPSFSPAVTGSGHGRRDVTLHPPSHSPLAPDVTRLQEILPWLAHNALVHYLAPRGLEQYSGGGWGTRDVCQGPVEMLLALGKPAPVRDLLLRVFKAQNPDGDWPQWFMFFDRERNIRPSDSHGDIVFWPLLALGKYLLACDDASLLDEVVSFFHERGDEEAEVASLWAHVERALAVIGARTINGTHLAAYGHGDWNDSLQPVDPAMRERLCSAWTVTLHYETLVTLAQALHRIGRGGAEPLDTIAPRIRDDFQRVLIADGVLTGFAYVHDDRRVDYLLHPRDDATGIHYRLLPMIHALLNGLLTKRQATAHVGYIKRHLLGPDGARLFNRPPRYQGGPPRYFQRAESSTFFGREIGLMYVHAHLRYAQAMAYYGDVDGFFLALRQANPIGIDSVVPLALPRQANCYYSSSDAAFADRYDASAHYAKLRRGRIAFEGGWRIYSSGAGIMVRLIHECFLGLRRRASSLIVDPVIPAALDGLRADVELAGEAVTVLYRVGAAGCGPTALTLNDSDLPFAREANPYRTGGAVVSMAALRARLRSRANTLVVQLS